MDVDGRCQDVVAYQERERREQNRQARTRKRETAEETGDPRG
jgi:hypothetical protein